MKFFALVILFVHPLIGFCSDWKVITKDDYTEELKSLEKVFLESMYQFDFNYKSFAGHQSKTPYDELKGHYTKWDVGYLNEFEGLTTICDRNIRVSINDELQSITMARTNVQDEAEMQKVLFDFTLTQVEKIEKRVSGDQINYRLNYLVGSTIESQEIIFVNGLMSKLIYYYSTPTGKDDKAGANIKPRMELEIKGFSTDVQLTNQHKISNYVTEVKKEYIGVGKFAKYQVLNFI